MFFKIIVHLLFCGSIFAVSDFLQIIESNLGDINEVCDNINIFPNDSVLEAVQKFYKEEIENLNIPEIFDLKKTDEPFLIYLQNKNWTEDIDQIADDYNKLCETDSESIHDFLRKIELPFFKLNYNNLKLDKNCTRASENLKSQYQIYFVHPNIRKMFAYKFDNLAIHLENIRAYYWLKENEEVLKKVTDLFNSFVEDVSKIIESTRWLKNTQSVISFKEVLRQIRLKNMTEMAYGSLKEIKEILKQFKNCTEYSVKLVCLAKITVSPAVNLNNAKSYNINPWILIHNTLLYSISNNTRPGAIYGTIGVALARELGHTVIKSSHDPVFLPYFSENVKNCVQKQINSSCSIFGQNLRMANDEAFENNSAEIFAVNFAFKQFKNAYEKEIHTPINESTNNLTNSQLFYLSYLSMSTDKSEIGKSAAIVQSSDFGNSFKCAANTRMMMSKTDQCYMFGCKAPLLR
ncbi:unnamed protein product [Caenorhabditis angaria]|uniref:Peptidase M13 C-terminal domain-containing protein n=1 Tax=Caenorhabditis angaria TaxID=860376 RepID=A0A9P1N311_9PELO|nr:unnamed protein product [Caenorhabditis angaria]